MGFAKYHEDDLNIFEERMYYKNSPDTLSIVHRGNRVNRQPQYTSFCPFCRSAFISSKELIHHIYNVHGHRYHFIFINGRREDSNRINVTQIFSLKLFCFYHLPEHIVITDDFEKHYYVNTTINKYEYDITNTLKGNQFSVLKINIPNREEHVEIQQFLDMNSISIDNILSGKYSSRLFDVRVSDDMMSIEDCITYIKMLIHEREDPEPFIIRIESIHFDASRELIELFWYYFLDKKGRDSSLIDSSEIKGDIWDIFYCILQGDSTTANNKLQLQPRSDNDAIGCRLICSYLDNDEKAIAYNLKLYKTYGLIGNLVSVLKSIRNYEESIRTDAFRELEELSLFDSYPLVAALVNLHRAEQNKEELKPESYTLLRNVGAIVAVEYCHSLGSDKAKEKIIKSNLKIHKSSLTLKNIALDNNFSWINRRISVSDGTVYYRKVLKVNNQRPHPFSDRFLNMFPYDDDISITSLGGNHEVGASCFVISYHGFNIMIDAGLNPQKKDDEAYPKLDSWAGNIDLIVLSHAHIDHSGAIPKAHAMWNNARILMTKPTKTLLKFIYSDMAKVKNGITDDFEIENVQIAKEVMEDTFRAICTVDYEDNIEFGKGIEICFHKAGHIAGAAMIELRIDDKTILYTGDYTDFDQNLISGINYQDFPTHVDYLITEATYLGRKTFDRYDQSEKLKELILTAITKKKSILLPAASIGRSQEIICLIGEMIEKSKIPEDYSLYLAGMAIPTTTQLIPYFNDEYGKLLSKFKEFDGIDFPGERSIVVASAGNLKRGSASYKIERNWNKSMTPHITIIGGSSDEDTEYAVLDQSSWYSNDRYRMPLSTHVNREGILKFIEYVEPKVVSVVHRGVNTTNEYNNFVNQCSQAFHNDICFLDLSENKKYKVFNLLDQLLEDNK